MNKNRLKIKKIKQQIIKVIKLYYICRLKSFNLIFRCFVYFIFYMSTVDDLTTTTTMKKTVNISLKIAH